MWKNLYRHITNPVLNNIYLFCFIWLLILWPEIYDSFSLKPHHLEFNFIVSISHAINLILISYLYTYILIYLYSCIYFKSFLRRTYLIVVFSLLLMHTIINLFCVITYKQILDNEIIAIIKGTNKNEMIEYFTTFFSFEIISVIVIVVFLLYVLLIYVLRGKSVNNKTIRLLSFTFLILGLVATIRRPVIFNEIFIGKYRSLFLYKDGIPKIEDFMTDPTIVKDSNVIPPKNIVIIVGESFSKSHSSLYKYNKKTNPKLELLKESGLLYVYSSVQSPSTSTMESFKSFMGTYTPEFKDSIQYNRCPTFIEILQKAGYNAFWFSNQSKKGLHDNLIGRYADLCNYDYFVGNMFSGINRQNFDGEIIELSCPYIEKSNLDSSMNLYLFHLMGSHSDFRRRYPKKFNRFNENDYLSNPEHQRKILAAYDNSILYNDSVVYELMDMFYNKEAIVIYFPDHGLDCYESDDNYIGHARTTVSESVKFGVQIPFMIYLSPLFKEKYPKITDKVKNNINEPFNTDDIVYTLMDIVGVKLR